MRVCVQGLWHLGSIIAACLAEQGHTVAALDFDEQRIAELNKGVAPVLEPDLERLLQRGLASGNLRFTSVASVAVEDAEVVWIAYDTPVDEEDRADSEFVLRQIERTAALIDPQTIVLISSQLSVGSIRRLELGSARPGNQSPLRIACHPENLRLGRAVSDFLHPDRIVVGVRSREDRQSLQPLFESSAATIEWMSIESAEMTKHALNAFLAASIVFTNEIATLCELTGADAREVERGLRSDGRIGTGAYVSPGGGFAGGTLARDVSFLNAAAREAALTTPLLDAILRSNDAHKSWARRTLCRLVPDLTKTTVAVLGLTYKPGTDTLRRSMAAELCAWLVEAGATVNVHDPVVKRLPQSWSAAVSRCSDPIAALRGAQAVVIATEWPLYREIPLEQLLQSVDSLIVLDVNRFLPEWAEDRRVRYFSVGLPGSVS